MARFFTKADAERLLAEIGPALEDAIRLKAEYQHFEDQLQGLRRRITIHGGVLLDRSACKAIQEQRDARANEFRSAIERIQNTGCIIKDLDTGLVDFPTLLRGREVYLCWKLGEPDIRFWHGVDEGFAGRKLLDREFLDNHRGDRAN